MSFKGVRCLDRDKEGEESEGVDVARVTTTRRGAR